MGHGLDVLFRLTVTWTLLGQTCQNVFYMRARPDDVSDNVEEDVNVMVNDTFDNITTPMRDNMSTDCVLNTIEAISLNAPPDRYAIHTVEGYAGIVVSPSLPSYVAAVMSWHTGYTGRRTHGRTYVMGIPQSHQDGNDLTAGAQTVLQNTANNIKNRYGLDGSSHRWYLTTFSKANGARRVTVPPPPHIVYDVLTGVPITRGDGRSRLFTQRRRLAGRGI